MTTGELKDFCEWLHRMGYSFYYYEEDGYDQLVGYYQKCINSTETDTHRPDGSNEQTKEVCSCIKPYEYYDPIHQVDRCYKCGCETN